MFGKVVGFFPRFASYNFPASTSFGEYSTSSLVAAGINSIGTKGFPAKVSVAIEGRFREPLLELGWCSGC